MYMFLIQAKHYNVLITEQRNGIMIFWNSKSRNKKRSKKTNYDSSDYMNTMNLRKLEKHLDDFTSGFTAPTYVTSGENTQHYKS